MQSCPHLGFPGTCEEALHFYEQTLGAKIQYISRYQETPMAAQVPPEFGGKIIHAAFTIGDSRIMAADAPPDRYSKAHGIAITLESASPEEAEKAFQALTAGGEVHMPFQKTFWSPGFGAGRDKYGIPWMVNTSVNTQQPQS